MTNALSPGVSANKNTVSAIEPQAARHTSRTLRMPEGRPQCNSAGSASERTLTPARGRATARMNFPSGKPVCARTMMSLSTSTAKYMTTNTTYAHEAGAPALKESHTSGRHR